MQHAISYLLFYYLYVAREEGISLILHMKTWRLGVIKLLVQGLTAS